MNGEQPISRSCPLAANEKMTQYYRNEVNTTTAAMACVAYAHRTAYSLISVCTIIYTYIEFEAGSNMFQC